MNFMVVKCILRYPKSTISHGISFQGSWSLSLTYFTDVDWASWPDDRKSTSGHCCFLGSYLISWSSSKQHIVSRSNAEFEYHGLTNAVTELICIETLLTELHLSLPSPPDLLCDNLSATQLVANPILHARTKNIEIDFHFIRECVVNKSLQVSSLHQRNNWLTFLPSLFLYTTLTKSQEQTDSPSPHQLVGDDKALIRVIS